MMRADIFYQSIFNFSEPIIELYKDILTFNASTLYTRQLCCAPGSTDAALVAPDAR